MSSEALAWAFKQDVKPSAVKFTLIALCECANYKTGAIHPSIAHIEEITGQNRKTIIANIAKLEERGFIQDTGQRIGQTKQIKVYRTAIGTVPETEQSQERNSSENGGKQSQKRDTEPSSEPSCSTETTSLPSITRERAPTLVCPRDVNEQVWKDFVAMRRSKRAPISETALAGIKREADKAGWSLNDALAECAARGWQGFNSTWVQDNRNDRQRTPFAKPTTREIGERVAAKLAARRA